MEIDRDEMGSEGNVVKSVKLKTVGGIKLGDIPEWLLVEVLIRMPVKLVFRSKLVSKKWLSLISDPYFMRMYVSRASISPQLQPWTFIYHAMQVEDSLGLDDPERNLIVDIHSSDFKHPSLHELPCPYTEQDPQWMTYRIFGVSNGLVLYGPLDFMSMFIYELRICSPTTRQWIRLPHHGRGFRELSMSFLTSVENGVLASYRVVCLDVSSAERNMIRSVIFISETGEWKEYTVYIDQKVLFDGARTPTSLKGILHWITVKHGIVAYDPYKKPDYLCIIALPGDKDRRRKYVPNFCDAYLERLRYFEILGEPTLPNGFSSFGIWILNDYSSGDWRLQHKISCFDILYDNVLTGRRLSLLPMSFHPFDSDIVYFGYDNIMVSYNINTRKLEAHGVPPDFEYSGEELLEWPSWWSFFFACGSMVAYIYSLALSWSREGLITRVSFGRL